MTHLRWVTATFVGALALVGIGEDGARAAIHPAAEVEEPATTTRVHSTDHPVNPSTSAAGTRTSPKSPTTQALTGEAISAADERRYCDALWLFEALHLRSPSPRALYNAAEVAFAAGDRVKALDLYRLTQQRYPSFEKSTLVQSRANKVFSDMTRLGPGTACPIREDVCGDWMLRPTDGGEQCDDGNAQNGDGCDDNCTLTGCGNGVVTAGEDCDDGNTRNGDGCDENCTPSSCGNGIITAPEACDDGNTRDGDGCDRTCVPSGCGNGTATGTEQCDDGNTQNGDGCDTSCTWTRCGNGIVTGFEQCDDGNNVGGDGCESDCSLTRVKQPLPGIVVVVLGSAAALGGGAALAGGLDRYAEADRARARLRDQETLFASDPSASLAGIDGLRAQIATADENARGLGAPLVVGGAGLMAAGVVGVGIGLWLAFTNTEVAGGAL
jgi:cysteine-rich repeat protein